MNYAKHLRTNMIIIAIFSTILFVFGAVGWSVTVLLAGTAFTALDTLGTYIQHEDTRRTGFTGATNPNHDREQELPKIDLRHTAEKFHYTPDKKS